MNGEKTGLLHGVKRGGGERTVAWEVEDEESGEECVAHVQLAQTEEEPSRGPTRSVDFEIRELEAAGGIVAAQGRPRRGRRWRFEDGGKVGPLDEGPAL